MTPPSRWRTGTLAVAGTIPVRSVNAAATLVRSEGHHPAGSPAPRPRAKAGRNPHAPGRAHHRLTGPGVKGACGVAARTLRAPVTPAAGSHDLAAIQDMRPDRHAPAPSPKSPRTGSNQAQNMQKLDRPLHMRSEPL